MVTTSTTAVASTTTITNNNGMLLYNNHNSSDASSAIVEEGSSIGGGITSCNTAATLEQYRLQLYNYALNMERLRRPPYTAAVAMAAAAAYASTTTVSTTTINCPSGQGPNYTGSSQVTSATNTTPPTSYLAGNLIAASNHMARSQSGLGQCPSNNRLALTSMSLFPQRIFQPEEPKPQHSYIGLIAMAILSSAETKLVLSDIYQYILDNYPYFRTRGPGWRNSIRHNLSLNDCFIKSGRSANGKGHYWAIHPANMEDFRKGDFRRRKAQRKVRKHMGLTVDDNGTDSPSPPPAMDLTSPSPPSFQHILMDSSTITPLATAAQHLAAQSFGWRFTHHRQNQQQHHNQQQAGAHTAASYMGQIFTYRPQHYAAAAAAAAALCHSGNTQQPLQQPQQLITPNTHHQHHQPPLEPPTDSSLSQQSLLLSSTQSSIATNVQVNVINELFSQKRKRQFDVASLLAPDNTNKWDRDREREQQHQYVRENEADNVRNSSCNDNIEVSSTAQNEIEIEDIDVVEASEDEDIEADYDHDDDEEEEADSNSNSRSRSPTQSHIHDDDDAHDHCKISKLKMSAEEEEETVYRSRQYETEDNDEEPDEENNNNNQEKAFVHSGLKNGNYLNSNSPLRLNSSQHSSKTSANTIAPATRTSSSTSSPPPPPSSNLFRPAQLLEQNNDIFHQSHHHHQQHHHPLSLNADPNHLFGRYYGTYMAAAAARIHSSILPANIVSNTD
ncbi:hypothetical protein DOY81_009903 [Sarcophaga bullata]|nr:hypothetical protein DOY81_009903 [Sarcophaga bullata]